MPLSLSEANIGQRDDGSRTATLVSHAAYHLDELVPLTHALVEQGISPRLVLVEAKPGALKPLRSQYRRYSASVRALEKLGLSLRRTGMTSESLEHSDVLVVMNDWGPSRELVEATRANGGLTFGKVEGAQNFQDIHSDKSRNAYGSVDVVLCQGQNDFDALPDRDRHIVGNTRLETILGSPPRSPASGPAVINANFSYGELVEHRSAWLKGCYAGCREAEAKHVVSRHPADIRPVAPWKVTPRRIEDLLPTATALISRFSSVCFEALARGVPLAYFNPHGEVLPPFTDPMGAFPSLRSSGQLAEYLQRAAALSGAEVRRNAAGFLDQQVNRTNEPSARRAAAAIASYFAG